MDSGTNGLLPAKPDCRLKKYKHHKSNIMLLTERLGITIETDFGYMMGKSDGFLLGRAKSKIKAIAAIRKELAIKLNAKGMDLTFISEVTSLPIQKIQKHLSNGNSNTQIS